MLKRLKELKKRNIALILIILAIGLTVGYVGVMAGSSLATKTITARVNGQVTTAGAIKIMGLTANMADALAPVTIQDQINGYPPGPVLAGQGIFYKQNYVQNIVYGPDNGSDGYTTVIVDLSGENGTEPVFQMTQTQTRASGMAVQTQKVIVRSSGSYENGITTNADIPGPMIMAMGSASGAGYISGSIIVQMQGESPQAFPVAFAGPDPEFLAWNNQTGSYNLSLSFGLANASDGTQGGLVLLTGSPDSSNGSVVPYFTINGQINVTGSNVQPLSDNATAEDEFDTYNNSIASGQTEWHQSQVTGNSTSLNVDVRWQNPQDDFRLMIYTPDGQTLGPYYDNSDGATDSQIYLNVANPDGVADGTWSYKLTDLGPAENDNYSIRTWE
jgi:hypothetical protein